MQYRARHLFICLLISTLSCWKAERDPAPEIIWERPLSVMMEDYCCHSVGNVSPPILLPGPSLLVSGTHEGSLASTFFNLPLSDLSASQRWEDSVSWFLPGASKHFTQEGMVFDSRREEAICIDLSSMETRWRIPAESSRSGFELLGDYIYLIRSSSHIDFVQLDLEGQSERTVYRIPPSETGTFAINPTPDFYQTEEGEHALVTVEKADTAGYWLTHFNISQDSLLWRVPLTGFSESPHEPNFAQAANGRAMVSSLDGLSVYELSTGQRLWSRQRFIDSQVENPVIYEDKVIVPGSNAITCRDLSTGARIWELRQGTHGIRWGSSFEMAFAGHYFFLSHNPINVETGEMYWRAVDQWGEQRYDTFEGPPAADLPGKALYYTNNESLFKIKLPE